jgi:hypothetical protein
MTSAPVPVEAATALRKPVPQFASTEGPKPTESLAMFPGKQEKPFRRREFSMQAFRSACLNYFNIQSWWLKLLLFAGVLMFPRLASLCLVSLIRAISKCLHVMFAQVVQEALMEAKGLANEIIAVLGHTENTLISIAEAQLFEVPVSYPAPAPVPPPVFYHPPVSHPEPPTQTHPSLWLAYFRGLETSAFLLCVLRLIHTPAPAGGQGPVGLAN